jgi:hypothetical protein
VEVEFSANAGPLRGNPRWRTWWWPSPGDRGSGVLGQCRPAPSRFARTSRTHPGPGFAARVEKDALILRRIAPRDATKAVQQHPGLGQNWRHGVYAGRRPPVPTDVAADLTRAAAAMAGASRIGAQKAGSRLERRDPYLQPAAVRRWSRASLQARRAPASLARSSSLKIRIRNFRGGRLSAAMTPIIANLGLAQ